MAYSELIKNFEKVRAYRLFFHMNHPRAGQTKNA